VDVDSRDAQVFVSFQGLRHAVSGPSHGRRNPWRIWPRIPFGLPSRRNEWTTASSRPRSSAAPRMGKRRRPTLPWNGWLLLSCHVPERRKQTIRYHGAYANSVRGRERKRQQAEPLPTVLEPVISSEAFRRNWAWLIQKVYEVSPPVCPRCQKEVRFVAAIENAEVIRRIPKHLGLWLDNRRPR
jgi:hypothetical protein